MGGHKIVACLHCGSTKNIQEHHISYNPEIKIPLCVKCHNEEHPTHGVGPPKGSSFIDDDEFIKLWEEGLTDDELQEKLSVCSLTVYRHRKGLGLPRNMPQTGEGILKILSSGRVTIPKGFRELFNLKIGDRVLAIEEEQGLRIVPVDIELIPKGASHG